MVEMEEMVVMEEVEAMALMEMVEVVEMALIEMEGVMVLALRALLEMVVVAEMDLLDLMAQMVLEAEMVMEGEARVDLKDQEVQLEGLVELVVWEVLDQLYLMGTVPGTVQEVVMVTSNVKVGIKSQMDRDKENLQNQRSLLKVSWEIDYGP